MAKQPKEEMHAMKFHDRNAGPEGVHQPGDIHEIPAGRAEALALDMVATYEDADMQSDVDARIKRAKEENRRRAAKGEPTLPPSHEMFRAGSERAESRPGHGAGPRPGVVPADVRAEGEAQNPGHPLGGHVNPDPAKGAHPGEEPTKGPHDHGDDKGGKRK
jgi:hypothetical protein